MERDQSSDLSRRRLVRLGAASVAAAVLGTALGPAAHAGSDGSGADGAPAGDTRATQRRASPLATANALQLTSYNGWAVSPSASAIGIMPYYVPGTAIPVLVKSGDVATVLMYVAGQFNRQVEQLRPGQVGGYEYRRNVNNPSVWSNHASGTAIDLNWVLHPNGAKGTFRADQLVALRRILAVCGDVVYWGGDYSGVVDGMHFEIDVAPGDPRLAALVARLRGGVKQPQVVSLRSRANNRFVTAEYAGGSPLIANRSVIGPWEQFDLLALGGGFGALRAHANGRWVCADRGGAAPLIANRTAVGPWETFRFIRNSDGTVSIRASVNGEFVCAEARGGQSLIANRTKIGPWEEFDLIGA